MSRFFLLPIAIALFVLAHWYIWARLARDTGLPPALALLARYTIIALAIAVPASFLLARLAHVAVPKPLVWVVFTWMGMMLLLLTLLAIGDLGRFALLRGVHLWTGAPVDAERRRLLGRALGGATALVGGSLGVLAFLRARAKVAVTDVQVELARLPAALDGTTIVQISDIHFGPTIGREFAEQLVATINPLHPDVIAITGDLVDGTVEELRELVAPFAKLRARHGVYFVTGNHEYYVSIDGSSGANEWVAELERLGIRTLRNERVQLGHVNGVDSFDLAGIDDWNAHGGGHGPDLAGALEGRDVSRACVLLAHQPRAAIEAAKHGVCLQLSGHTHGGQIWPWMYFVRLQQPFVAGLDRIGDTHVYTSRGTGYWGPPMRLGAPAEITRIVLRSSSRQAA